MFVFCVYVYVKLAFKTKTEDSPRHKAHGHGEHISVLCVRSKKKTQQHCYVAVFFLLSSVALVIIEDGNSFNLWFVTKKGSGNFIKVLVLVPIKL